MTVDMGIALASLVGVLIWYYANKENIEDYYD